MSRQRPALTDPGRPLTVSDSLHAMRFARLAAEACGEGKAKYQSTERGVVLVTWRRVVELPPRGPREEPRPHRFTVTLRREDGEPMDAADRHLLALRKLGGDLVLHEWSMVPEEGLLVVTVGPPPARASINDQPGGFDRWAAS